MFCIFNPFRRSVLAKSVIVLCHDTVSSMALSSSAADTVETVVIGAGVIGLAVARALVVPRKASCGTATNAVSRRTTDMIGVSSEGSHEVLILDRAATIGSETSSRNSQVVHGGMYYPSHSKKAVFCVRGRAQLYQYCASRNIQVSQCGKLIVATNSQQRATLMRLQEQAVQNGIQNTSILSSDDVRVLEPSIAAPGGALLSPSTGIFDSHHFLQCLLADAMEQQTATLILRTAVDDARIVPNNNTSAKLGRPWLLQIHVDDIWLTCTNVINCAGLWANHIADLFHNTSHSSNKTKLTEHDHSNLCSATANPPKLWKPPPIYFAKGTYFRLQNKTKAALFKHLIYPIPDTRGGGLGIHATMDLTGQVIRFGPDVEWLPKHWTHRDIDDHRMDIMRPQEDRSTMFYDAIRTYWPDIPNDSLVPDYVGIRPKLSHPEKNENDQTMPFQDFSIVGPEQHGVAGLVHLFGIESPGLTSSMAIADHVVDLLLEQ